MAWFSIDAMNVSSCWIDEGMFVNQIGIKKLKVESSRHAANINFYCCGLFFDVRESLSFY